MELPEDYKNIVKLRFNFLQDSENDFFNSFYAGLADPENYNLENFERFSLDELLYYLKKSHQEYLNIWFPKIESIIKDVQNELGVNEITLTLKSFVVHYYNELTNHINFEEKVLYNFVEKLTKGIYVEKEKVFVLNHFLETHNHDVSDELNTIQKVVINKDSSILESKNVKILFEYLKLVQNDLTLHGFIEDELLISKIHAYIEEKF